MIRFVDVRGQGLGENFAFWNTVYDQFIYLGGEMAWSNWEEFEEVAMRFMSPGDIERYRRLSPAWVERCPDDDVEAWACGNSEAGK